MAIKSAPPDTSSVNQHHILLMYTSPISIMKNGHSKDTILTTVTSNILVDLQFYEKENKIAAKNFQTTLWNKPFSMVLNASLLV